MKLKKFICAFLCVFLFSNTAFAQTISANFVLPVTPVLENETFTASLNINFDKQFFAHSFKIEFDSTAVELLTTENCNILRDGVAKVAFSLSPNNTVTTVLQFKVLKRQNITFKISDIAVSDGIDEYYFDDIIVTFQNSEYQKGDLDLNGKIDVTDLAILKKQVAGLSPISNAYISDYDSSGTVDVTDLALLKKFIAGL